MRQISIVDRINRRKYITAACLILLALAIGTFLLSRGTKKTEAFSYTTSSMTISNGDVLYIGAGGLQSERVWSDDALRSDINMARNASGVDTNYILPARTAAAPLNRVYGPSEVTNMVYPATGGCPAINSDQNMQNGTAIAAGKCKAIITDGKGAIIRISGDIYIDGYLFLGDRVALVADNITLGPNGKIIGSGQDGGDATDHDKSALGGIGAHNGGQTALAQAGAPVYSTSTYYPNLLSYYEPLRLSTELTTFFTDSRGNAISGGNGSNGGTAECKTGAGEKTPPEIGIGGSGGSGGANGVTGTGDNTGAGGGGGGGYGIALVATNNITTNQSSIIDFSGGDFGQNADLGGPGGPGGGGVVVFKAKDFLDKGSVLVNGGTGLSGNFGLCQPTRGVSDGENGIFTKISVNDVSIKKRLFAVEREDVPNTAFNPYALQANDVIRVEITATRLIPPALVSDKYLTIGGNSYDSASTVCQPSDSGGGPLVITDSASVSTPPGANLKSIDGDSIVWNVTSNLDASNNPITKYVFYYYCKIVKR